MKMAQGSRTGGKIRGAWTADRGRRWCGQSGGRLSLAAWAAPRLAGDDPASVLLLVK